MPYLSNAAVNRLNIHSGLHMLAWSVAGNFFFVFLLRHGFSPAEALVCLASILTLRFALRPIILFVGPRFGLRYTLCAGCVLTGAQYLVLAHVQGTNGAFFAFCFVYALADIFYWTSYHAMYAATGDVLHRGKQISVRETLATAAAIVGPLIGGWTLDHAGPNTAFALGALIEFLAILPVLQLPDFPVARQCPAQAFRAARTGVVLFATDGWIQSGFMYAWSIMLFGAAGKSFTAFGGALALAGLVSVLGGLLLGRLIDDGHGHRAVILNGILLVLAIVLRASAHQDIGAAYAVTAASALVGACYMPTLMTAFYNLAARAPCPMRFMFVTEGAWDVGCASGALLGAGLLACGVAPGWTVALAVCGAAVQTAVLRRFYAAEKREKSLQ
jgi:DHA1 family inner membrane transport protein